MKVSVLISTYNRPWHLRRCLLSLDRQKDVTGAFEVIVTDDGSNDETIELLHEFRRTANFPLSWTTHEHDGFQLARCRNEGVAVSRADYLLFSDGDCIFPLDHVAWHLRLRSHNHVLCGDSWRIPQVNSESIDEMSIREGRFLDQIPSGERRRLRGKYRHARLYEWLCFAALPRLTGCNFSIWRSDYQRVNGFDEEFRGWGFEDRDLQIRLSHLRVRFKSVLHRTAACHLWHRTDPTFIAKGLGTANRRRFEDTCRPTYCRLGLDSHLGDAGKLPFNAGWPPAPMEAAA